MHDAQSGKQQQTDNKIQAQITEHPVASALYTSVIAQSRNAIDRCLHSGCLVFYCPGPSR